ncbi:DUF1552 domain-containing protein [uncultured Paludibaculum sp.]|uniref:DUF1552 domain-containing protein n=1 Tax=uncultured Paludibaculum sp. TaxID=1765020 RepID=UPI002AAA7B72|nr:DUF1552 domain-containing protein [uncultured Paludibaculum sp.]
MALPWLQSFSALAETTNPVFPKRFAVLFMGNGVNEDHWSSDGSGAGMTLSKTLSPLEPLKHKINVIHGLFQKRATGHGIHPPQTGSLLSGADIRRGAIIRAGTTVDQVVANRMGRDCAQPSIVLACEQPMTGYHETNYSMAYSSHISWQSPDSPVPNEVYPSLAWDNLFENRGNLRNMSVLDRVKDDAAALGRQISSDDKTKLDEYLTSVREVEKRIDRLRGAKDKAEETAKQHNRPVFSMDRPANGLPEDLRDHARLMCDIIAIAFQTDKTRVASLLLARDLSAMYYPFLEVREGHHAASHHNLSDGYERIARFHLSQLAYLATKLDSMPEGNGTVLDNSCLMWLSNMWIGRKHDNTRLPLVLAGGLGGTLKTGRTLSYLEDGDDNRKLCSLFLSIMDRMDVKLDQFGDAETRLQRL